MALTKYKSKVDSGTGEKNEISLKDVYEWVQSRQLSGGNEGTPPPCEGVHSIGFQLEALEGYDTCQKIKITLTSPAANFGLYDWAFEIYLKTGLAYELKETIIVAGAAENLEVSSQKLDVHGEYRVKGVLFHKGTTCTIAQLINEIETSECEKNIIPPTTECFDETCNPPCLCPSEGNERPPEEAGAIKIKLSESEVPEGGILNT